MTSLILTLALLLLPWWLFKVLNPKGGKKNTKPKRDEWAVIHYRHLGFIGEISDFTKGQQEIALSASEEKVFEKGERLRNSIYEAERSKNKQKVLSLRQKLATNEQWALVVGKQHVYENTHNIARLLADHGEYDEAFSLASSLTTIGAGPFKPETPTSYGFYYVESLAVDAMSHVCRRQGHLRDAVYQNMYGLRVSVLEVHYSKLRDEPVTVEGFVALKARITDARHALGKRNEIAKILELPKAQEREIATLVRQYVGELVDCVHETKTKIDRDAATLTIFQDFSSQVLALIPDTPKHEMILRTKNFDNQ